MHEHASSFNHEQRLTRLAPLADIHQFVYLQIGDVLDALSLINCYVGPIACCFLSSQYRDTLRSFFRERAVYRPRSYSAVSKQLGSCEINGSMLRFNDDRDVLL